MKVALVGCGRIAINHIKAIRNNKLELVALCDVNLSRTDELLKRAEFLETVDKYFDYNQMLLEHPEIDIVAVATDSGAHAKIAIDCLKNNKHVIVEKPMAMNMGDANEMIRIAKEKNLKLCVCHHSPGMDARVRPAGANDFHWLPHHQGQHGFQFPLDGHLLPRLMFPAVKSAAVILNDHFIISAHFYSPNFPLIACFSNHKIHYTKIRRICTFFSNSSVYSMSTYSYFLSFLQNPLTSRQHIGL